VIEGVIRNTANAPRSIPPLRIIMRDGEVEVHSLDVHRGGTAGGRPGRGVLRTEIADLAAGDDPVGGLRHGAVTRVQPSIRIARKSLTLVSVGPVTTRSPSAAKKL
jgi:hypothetical protein